MSNNITVVGNLTREPDLRYAANGSAMCKFGIASNRRWKDKDGEWQEKVTFFDCVIFGDMAENFAQSTTKGTGVVVTGRMEGSSYENEEGETRTKTEMIVDDGGPSLRWATCQVEKVARKTAN